MGIWDTTAKPRLTPKQQYAADDAMAAAYKASKDKEAVPSNGAVLGAPVTDQDMANHGYSVPIPGSVPEEAPAFPGVDDSTAGGISQAEGTEGAIDARGFAFGRMPVGMGPKGVVQGPGEDYSRVGGAHCKSDWEDTFVTKPQQIEQALMEGADAEGRLGEAKADFYKRQQQSQSEELSVLQARRAQRQTEIDSQQAHLQQATERYSNDLADRGKFWNEPAHIIGAFGAALLAFGGRADIGTKLITEAVNSDFQARKQLADMHLGELRSNLHSYRQIAGDKDIGDRMGLAESYRVAAMELERIAGQFQGPLAKARAAATAKDLMMQRQTLMMNMYHALPYQKAEVVDPRIAAANKAAGAGLPEGVGYTPFAAQGGKSDAGPAAGPGVGPSAQPGQTMSGQPSNPAMDHVLNTLMAPIPEDKKARWEARAPGSSRQVEKERMDIARRIWSVSGGNPQTFNTKMEAFEAKQEDDIKGIAVAAQPIVARIDGYRRLGTDIGLIKVMADRMHTDPDTLLGNGSAAVMGKEFMAKYRDTIHLLSNTNPDQANKYARELQSTENAVERFKQILAGQHNVYIHDKSGGNVSEKEDARMQEYLRKGYRGIQVFHDDQSRLAHTEFENATNSAAHPVSGTLYRIQMGMGSNQLDRPGIAGPSPMGGSAVSGMNEKRDANESARQQNIQRAIQAAKGK